MLAETGLLQGSWLEGSDIIDGTAVIGKKKINGIPSLPLRFSTQKSVQSFAIKATTESLPSTLVTPGGIKPYNSALFDCFLQLIMYYCYNILDKLKFVIAQFFKGIFTLVWREGRGKPRGIHFSLLTIPNSLPRELGYEKGSDPKDQTKVRNMRDAKDRSTV